MTAVEREPVRILTRSKLVVLSRAVAARGQNYGRPAAWVEANVQSGALIPLYVLLQKGLGLRRCVVVPQLNNASRGRFSIDLLPQEIDQLPVPSEDEARALLRELVEYVPPIPLTLDQREEWKAAGYDVSS
jgi:hypothetical protein